MKSIIPKDTRYIPFTQQKSCCVPTSINIVMYKLGIPLIPQELLGYYLGLILPVKYRHLFFNPRKGKKYKTGYGVYKSIVQYNNIFKKLNIPLKIKKYPIKNFKNQENLISFIHNFCKKDKDFAVLLQAGVLNDNRKRSGHMCVVDKIYPDKKVVRLIDPSPNAPKWREISVDKLRKAMEHHPTGGGAFWELKKV